MADQLPILSDPPINDSMVEEHVGALGRKEWRITRIWENYHRSRDQRINIQAHTEHREPITTNQTAGIGATALVTAANVANYRISAYIQQTIAAGVSASLQIIIRWTSLGVNLSKAGTVLTTNTTSTYEALPAFMVRVDPGTNISYEVVYASNPANAAAYQLDVVAEAVG